MDIENDEPNSFEFSTTTSPSLNSLSENLDNLLSQDVDENKLDSIADEIAPYQEETEHAENITENENLQEEITEEPVVEEEPIEVSDNNDVHNEESEENSSEQIEALFSTDENSEDTPDIISQKPKQKSSIKLLAIIGLLVVLGAVGYLGYNQFANQAPQEEENNVVADSVQTPASQQQEEAMPI